MEIFTFGVLLAVVAKLGVAIGGVTGMAKGVSWFNKKSFNNTKKVGALHDRLKHDSEEI